LGKGGGIVLIIGVGAELVESKNFANNVERRGGKKVK